MHITEEQKQEAEILLSIAAPLFVATELLLEKINQGAEEFFGNRTFPNDVSKILDELKDILYWLVTLIKDNLKKTYESDFFDWLDEHKDDLLVYLHDWMKSRGFGDLDE